MFITVCAWCGRDGLLNVLDWDVHGKDAISHGICPKHLEQVKQEVFDLDNCVLVEKNA